MEAAAIRDALRDNHQDENLKMRRRIMALTALGIVDFTIISLYQSGVIRNLPDFPGKIFASNEVNAAKDAYMLTIPDGPVSLTAYAAIMALAAWGGTEQTGRKPFHELATGTLIAANAVGAVYYLSNMIFKQKKICPYCITGAAVNIASAVLIAPSFIKSLKRLFN